MLNTILIMSVMKESLEIISIMGKVYYIIINQKKNRKKDHLVIIN